MNETSSVDEVALVERLVAAHDTLMNEVSKAVYGQHEALELMLVSLLCRGHSLLLGLPGLGKTLMANTIARSLDLDFCRIQFTPDLMPADITGTDVIDEDPDTGRRFREFLPGPIFANLVLADEINRTPPKTQAALLQAMQEHEVSVGRTTYELKPPFMVLATQNPIELEGTYVLPEAQLDRFMFNIDINYPTIDQEIEMVASTTSSYQPELRKVINAEKILEMQELVRKVPASTHVIGYAVKLVRASRPKEAEALPLVKEWTEWGAGPRASQYLILASKARAVMDGRYVASVEDIKAVLPSIMKHRIITNFKAQAEGITSLDIIERLLQGVKP